MSPNDNDVFDLGLSSSKPDESKPVEGAEEPSGKKQTTKKPKKKRRKKSKRPPVPDLSELDTDGSGTLDSKELLQGRKMPKAAPGTPPVTLDTLPQEESRLEKAKKTSPRVSRWDKFLSGLSRGTMEALYEMGISGLETGKRSLVNLGRSDLLKPNGKMLSQMVDEVESEMSKFDLTLKPAPPTMGAPIRTGTKLPKLGISGQERQNREMRRRGLRSTL